MDTDLKSREVTAGSWWLGKQNGRGAYQFDCGLFFSTAATVHISWGKVKQELCSLSGTEGRFATLSLSPFVKWETCPGDCSTQHTGGSRRVETDPCTSGSLQEQWVGKWGGPNWWRHWHLKIYWYALYICLLLFAKPGFQHDWRTQYMAGLFFCYTCYIFIHTELLIISKYLNSVWEQTPPSLFWL